MGAGFTLTAAAFAILLSVIVRQIRSGASWQAIAEGRATAENLREVTGIMEREKLQEVFGPPRLDDGVFPVTRKEVMRERTGLGYLFGDKWLDGGSALIALAVVLPLWPVWGGRMWLETLLAFACLYQAVGWVAAFRFMDRN